MKPSGEQEMSLVGHLGELRTRLIIGLIAIVLTTCLAFFIAEPVLSLLTQPVKYMAREPGRTETLVLNVAPDGDVKMRTPASMETLSTKRLIVNFLDSAGTTQTFSFGELPTQQFYYPSPLDPIMMQLKVAFLVGILLALPFIMYQVWAFVRPGLKTNEVKIVRPLLLGAIFLFPIGATFAYYMVGLLMRVIQSYSIEGIDPLFDIYKYLSLLMVMMLVFGIIFELPLVIAVAARIGLVTPAMLTHYRRHAIVGLAFAAMILTPADPFSMMATFIPLVILYEISVIISRPMARLHRKDLQTLEV